MFEKEIQPINCPECGSNMVRDIRPFTVEYKGFTETVDAPGWYCTRCDEAVFVGKDIDAADKALVRLKAQAEHLLQPEQIRKIRKKLALTQAEAGELLGGGRNAFQKYESAQITTTKSLSVLLRLLEQQPEMLNLIREDKFPYIVDHGTHKK
jgi:HTH-type transcriptional regulator/antitoxin MqsA